MDKFLLPNIFFCFLIVAIPIFMQQTAHQSIDENKFKKYKVKKLGFLFKGMQGESARTSGVILPMLAIQIQGYVLGILTLSFVILNEIFKFIEESIAIVIVTLFVHVIIVIFVTMITGIISKRKC